MIYFSATIRAMTAHIETLQAQITALEAERAALLGKLDADARAGEWQRRIDVLTEQVLASQKHAERVDEAHAQIADLKDRLAAADIERSALLNRLLSKERIAPIQPESDKSKDSPAIQVVAPFGVTQDAQDAIKRSFMAEELEYQTKIQGHDYERALQLAEHEWLARNRAVL